MRCCENVRTRCGATRRCCLAAPPVTLGEGMTPLIHARRLGTHLGLDAALHQGRRAEPDRFVQGARALGRGQHGEGARGRDDRAADRGQRRWRGGGLRGASRPWSASSRCRPTRRSRSCSNRAPSAPTCRLIDGLISDCGTSSRSTPHEHGWFEVSTLEGAVSHRRQEDDGVRAVGGVRAASCPT